MKIFNIQRFAGGDLPNPDDGKPTSLEPVKTTIVQNDATYPWAYDEVNKVYTSTNKVDDSTSTLQIKPTNIEDGPFTLFVSCNSEENWDKATFYLNDTQLDEISGIVDKKINVGDLLSTDIIKVTYVKDPSTSSGNDEVKFSLNKEIVINGSLHFKKNEKWEQLNFINQEQVPFKGSNFNGPISWGLKSEGGSHSKDNELSIIFNSTPVVSTGYDASITVINNMGNSVALGDINFDFETATGEYTRFPVSINGSNQQVLTWESEPLPSGAPCYICTSWTDSNTVVNISVEARDSETTALIDNVSLTANGVTAEDYSSFTFDRDIGDNSVLSNILTADPSGNNTRHVNLFIQIDPAVAG